MKPEYTLRDRLRYAFDNTMSKGIAAQIALLGFLSLLVVIIAGALVSILRIAPEGSQPLSFPEAAWESLMRTLDAGTMGGDAGWQFRIAMFIVTLAGVFVISILIGILTSGIEAKLEDLRKGRSRVIERGHTVILGWTPQVFTIIGELVAANRNKLNGCIVILGDEDKIVMEDEIRAKVPDVGSTRVVCRRGSPIEMADLAITSLNTAKSIIILSPEDKDPDSSVIKVILAITNNPGRPAGHRYNIVAEVRDPKNLEVARMVGKDEVELVVVGDLIARIIAQTCRQAGLSVVYTELLDFDGDEIYFGSEPALVGKTFGEALLAYEDSAVIGLAGADGSSKLNPSMDTIIQPGDRIIAVTEDDDTLKMSARTELLVDYSAIRAEPTRPHAPERTLVLGWNWRAPAIINELDNYVAPGSQLLIVGEHDDAQAHIEWCCQALKNTKVEYRHGETSNRRLLDDLGVDGFHHVIVLSCFDDMDPQESDARTLVTLLHLRDMAEKAQRHFSITSEMIDIRNRNLAEVARADDFIVSDKLVSLMMAQVSENPGLNAVFTDLFDPEGAEIYLKPASEYVLLGQPVTFFTVVEAARRRGEVALGYRIRAQADDAGKQYGVRVNPDKYVPVTFTEKDKIIVLADS